MATVEGLITTALRKARIVGLSGAPTLEELTVGLEALQGLYAQWVGEGRFGQFTEVLGSSSVTADENNRIRRETSDAWSVTIPDTVDGDGLSESRAPRDRSVVRVANPFTGAHVTALYDANTGSWWALNSLTLSGFAPLSNLGDGLACCLAEVLAEEDGGAVGPVTQRTAMLFRSNLKYRPRLPDEALCFEDYR